MVQKIKEAPWGSNTNFRKALKLILDTALENNIPPKDMENMSLIIFTDMQIDCPWNNHTDNNLPIFVQERCGIYIVLRKIRTQITLEWLIPEKNVE